MALDKISVSPFDYVVLDVETNGLRSKDHDLLSLSIFKPDDGKEFDRLFPLDMNSSISKQITAINGIKTKDLKGKTHLTQDEFDSLVKEFELDRRIILHYGAIDPRFVRDYLARQKIKGFNDLHFFNFKQRICSSRFSRGNLTKDNLCKMFGIKGVKKVHSGLNDCKLEWELFKKINGDYLLVTAGGLFHDRVFRLNQDYIVPVSYLSTHPNLSKAFERPYIVQESEVVFRHQVHTGRIAEKLSTNITGITLEHLLNTLLDVHKVDSKEFLLENKKKLQFVGTISSLYESVPLNLNPDGTVTAVKEEDKELEQRINYTNEALKPELKDVVEYIKTSIFNGKPIQSQELIVDEDLKILALCDLSTDEAVLEIKTGKADPALYAEQLFYEANGRDAYLMCFEWVADEDDSPQSYIAKDVVIYRVKPAVGEKPNKKRDRAIAKINGKLAGINAKVETFETTRKPIELRCGECGQVWTDTHRRIMYGSALCPICHPRPEKKKKPKVPTLSFEEQRQIRIDRYAKKVAERSSGTLLVDKTTYTKAKESVRVECSVCGYSWTQRADHLLRRCSCPKCRMENQI